MTLAEHITAARKAKGYTQEQLAVKMNVSRPTVSHWENGRVLPDVEMLKALSGALETDLFSDGTQTPKPETAEKPPEAQADTPVPEQTAAGEAPVSAAKPPRKAWRYLCLSAFLLLIVGGALFFLLREKPQTVPAEASQTQTAPPTAETTTQTAAQETALEAFLASCDATPAEGQAFVKVYSPENPVKAVRWSEGKEMWFFTVILKETNDIAFTVEKVIEVYFMNGGYNSGKKEYAPADVGWGDGALAALGTLSYNGGFPVQALEGLGITVTGTDANGNTLTFSGYIALSKEIAEE